jgi:hypothetical protein
MDRPMGRFDSIYRFDSIRFETHRIYLDSTIIGFGRLEVNCRFVSIRFMPGAAKATYPDYATVGAVTGSSIFLGR